jgi:hypothetical protein
MMTMPHALRLSLDVMYAAAAHSHLQYCAPRDECYRVLSMPRVPHDDSLLEGLAIASIRVQRTRHLQNPNSDISVHRTNVGRRTQLPHRQKNGRIWE